MKILMFANSFGSPTTTFIRNEIDSITNNGDEVLFLCNEIVSNKFKFLNFSLKQIPFKENRILKKINWLLWQKDLKCSFKNKKFSNLLKGHIRAFKPDIIHCHFAYESLKVLDNLPKCKSPIIVHFHGYGASQMLNKNSYVKAIDKHLLKKNVFPIYVSDFMKKALELKKINLKKGIKLYYGTDLNGFITSSTNKKSDKFTFLQVSSLVEKKGHEFTIRAFAQFLNKVLDRSLYEFIFTGHGENLHNLKVLCKKLNINENVKFVGIKSKNEVINLMKLANVFVHNSITAKNGDQEGVPNAIMEAMAMNLPVLSTFHAGIPELVEDGVNGYLSEEKNIHQYANNMLKIINWNKEVLNREKIEKIFSKKIHFEKLYSFYKNI